VNLKRWSDSKHRFFCGDAPWEFRAGAGAWRDENSADRDWYLEIKQSAIILEIRMVGMLVRNLRALRVVHGIALEIKRPVSWSAYRQYSW
jgi:hypothetical protein